MARFLIILISCWSGLTFAQPGLDPRVPIGAYLDGNLPTDATSSMPFLLSATGAFSPIATRTPHPGLVPYELNSPLWTDGALKSRYIALPYGGNTGSPTITFSPTGSWTFPAGTVIVKNFDMVVNEQNNTVRRLETRLLVSYLDRNGALAVRGATYKWRIDHSDAELLPDSLNETLIITDAVDATRAQNYSYPSPAQCLRCHNPSAGLVLGLRTAQQNSTVTYSPGRVDNQLRTLSSLGMFNAPLLDTDIPNYDKMAGLADATATLEHRVRSYLSSNCGHCHRGAGNGEAPFFDARFETPILQQYITGHASTPGWKGLIRSDLPNSRLYIRDSVAFPNPQPMPPIARNIPDPDLLTRYAEWVNYAYDIAAVTVAPSRTQVRVQFNRDVEGLSAATIGNYTINNGAAITGASLESANTVLLTTATLPNATSFTLTVNRVKELAAPQNPVWPNSTATFGAPEAPGIAITQAGNGQVTLSFSAPNFDGGALITSYTASCTNGANTVTATSSTPGITVTGLTNGITYNCTVTATNAANFVSPASSGRSVTPIAPILLSVTSTKTHGNAGTFALPIAAVADINANVTVEPRRINGTHSIVFRFDIPITSAGSVSLVQTSLAGGAMATSARGINTNEIIVTLTGVTDNQRIAITLSNIDGVPSAGATAFIGFIAGDVNNSRSVTPGDVSSVKARAGQTTNSGNFWFDLNASGSINAADIAAVKARLAP